MSEIDFRDIEYKLRKERLEKDPNIDSEADKVNMNAEDEISEKEAEADSEEVSEASLDDSAEEYEENVDDADDKSNETGNNSTRRLPDAPSLPDEDTTFVSVEMGPDGTYMTTDYKKDAEVDMEIPKRKSKVKSRRIKAEVVYLRDMPKSLVNEARRIFPAANNNTDAVAAYVAYKSGVTNGLNEAQLELLNTTDVIDPIVEQNQRIARIERTITNMFSVMQELEMAMSYMIFDRLGFRRENPDAPRQANLNEPGMMEMIERVREVSKQMRKQESLRKGRPLR